MTVVLIYNNKYCVREKNNNKNLLKMNQKLNKKYRNLIKNIWIRLLIYQ